MTNVTSFATPVSPPAPSLAALQALLHRSLQASGGWMGFDRFMALALYAPGLGYYSRNDQLLGSDPHTGSDFVTAPELSPYFGRTLAKPVRQALLHTQSPHVLEFGAGSGALAAQLLHSLGDELQSYTIIELSAALQQRQRQTLAAYADKVHWLNAWPEHISGVVLGNEVIDAMPVKLLQRTAGVWHERGVVWDNTLSAWQWADRPTELQPPTEVAGEHDYLCEIHPQAQAFVASLAERVLSGAKPAVAMLLDYGFPAAEYYHPQRHMGTVMCHRAHRADADPLVLVGDKDITAHVNFTELAWTAQEAGLHVGGYTSQAHYLINCGLVDLLATASEPDRITALKLVHEHEMGELFKVLVLSSDADWQPMGFEHGDRTHAL